MDKLITWVMTGTSSSLASFIIYVSILSEPQDLEFFKLSMILSISSGWTHLKLKLHLLFDISLLTNAKGSPAFLGRFLRSNFTLLMKKLFIILARSFGLEKMLPLFISFVGGPPLDHPNQFLTFFQIALVSFPNSDYLFSLYFFFSFRQTLVILFLNCLYFFQSSGSLLIAAFFCAWSRSLIVSLVFCDIQGTYLVRI